MSEFLKWMEDNRDRLKTYSNQEIADIAIAVGQDRSVVNQWLIRERFKAA